MSMRPNNSADYTGRHLFQIWVGGVEITLVDASIISIQIHGESSVNLSPQAVKALAVALQATSERAIKLGQVECS